MTGNDHPSREVQGLEAEAVRRWLERMHPTDICGIAGRPGRCPLAVYLAEANGLKGGEGDWSIMVLDEDYEIEWDAAAEPVTGDLPDWAARFVERVDQHRPYLGEVTAQQALEVLSLALLPPEEEDDDEDDEEDEEEYDDEQ